MSARIQRTMKTSKPLIALSLCTFALGGVACGSSEPVAFSIPFSAVVGDQAFACGTDYDGVGKDGATITPGDLRFYVHDVTVVDEDGNDVAVTLDTSDAQLAGAVLLDFEDGTGACDTGSPGVNTAITGTIPGDVVVSAVRFTIGLPDELNHLDATTAEAPLNIPSLFWTWASGYIFMKVEAVNDADDVAYFHHGSTGCDGTPAEGFSCAYKNLAPIELPFTKDDQVVLDLEPIFAGVDVEAELAEDNRLRGCMSFSGDADCVSMFGAIGITYEENGGSPKQSAFSTSPR